MPFVPSRSMTLERAMSDCELRVNLYEHGGARVFFESPEGGRDLVADLYDDEGGERRDKIIAALRALDLKPRK
jgi:hypothetical protein